MHNVAAGRRMGNQHPMTEEASAIRLARTTDPKGNQWSVSTHIEYVTPEQVAARLAEMGEG